MIAQEQVLERRGLYCTNCGNKVESARMFTGPDLFNNPNEIKLHELCAFCVAVFKSLIPSKKTETIIENGKPILKTKQRKPRNNQGTTYLLDIIFKEEKSETLRMFRHRLYATKSNTENPKLKEALMGKIEELRQELIRRKDYFKGGIAGKKWQDKKEKLKGEDNE